MIFNSCRERERIQEEFFHTFNDIYDSQRQIFLTSDRPAGEIDKIESSLLSRFNGDLLLTSKLQIGKQVLPFLPVKQMQWEFRLSLKLLNS
jgi:chromosomal replication initiator protein